MEINKIFNWPMDIVPDSSSLRLQPLSIQSQSQFTGSVKALNLGKIWVGNYSFPSRSSADAQRLQAFMDRVGGPANIIRMPDWTRKAPFNLGRSTATLKGEAWDDGFYFDDGYGWAAGYSPTATASSSKGSTTLYLGGLPASTSNALVQGDVFELNQAFYNINVDVTSDAAGDATISIQPPLRSGVAAGDALVLYHARCNMRLTGEADGIVGQSLFHGQPFTLTLVEDVQ